MTMTLRRGSAPPVWPGTLLGLGFVPPAAAEAASPEEDSAALTSPFREGEHGIALRLQPQLGDLSTIRERGVLRVLVTCNSTSFFIRDGELHGLVPTLMRAFSRQLDAARPRGSVPLRLHRIIPVLEAGYGDVAAARLQALQRLRGDCGGSQWAPAVIQYVECVRRLYALCKRLADSTDAPRREAVATP